MRTKNVQSELDLSDVWGIGEALVKRDDLYLQSGDVLVSSANSWNLVGKCCWVPELPWFSTFGGFVSLLRADRDKIDPRFLFHWFASDRVQATVRSFGQQTTNISNLNVQRCLKLPLLLPLLPEQRRIVEILDKADSLRAKRRVALTQLDAFTQSVFLEMFGDPKLNRHEWPVRDFGSMIRDESSRSEKLQQSEFLPRGRYPVVDQGQSKIAGYCDEPRYLCQSALPVIVFGDHTRVVKLVREPFVVGADGAKVLAPQPGVDAVFLSWLLRLSPIPDLGYSRHMREVKRLRFPTPPFDLQMNFACRAELVEKSEAALNASLEKMDALFSSLQNRAFRGEL
jgi:type I restriction enzyme S subunit